MRDKNLTYLQFNIQLEKNIDLGNYQFQKFFRERVTITPTFLEGYYFLYPKDFRQLRVLSIIQWYFPEIFHYRIWLDLTDMTFSHLNKKQRIEIFILLSSKENMKTYLYETNRYSSYEIFGNFLKNDLKELLRNLKILKKSEKLVIPKRKRGYSDHGSRRPSEKWLPRTDISFNELQLRKERQLKLQRQTIDHILNYFENLRNGTSY